MAPLGPLSDLLNPRSSLFRSRSRSRSRVRGGDKPSQEAEKGSQTVSTDPASRNFAAFALNNRAHPGGANSSTARQERSGPEDYGARVKVDSAEPKKFSVSQQPAPGKPPIDDQGKQCDSDSATATAGRSQSQDASPTSGKPKDEAAKDDGNVWSAAYHDAVQKLDEDKREIILRGENFDQLLKDLGERDAESIEDSFFRRGLKKVKGPLENVKLAVDLAQPLIGLEPAAATATGAVQSFTIVAVGICGASEALTTQITHMLQRAAIIGECDRVGQGLSPESTTIHEQLVQVYTQLLEFYVAATRFFSQGKMFIRLVSEAINNRLPPIIEEFLFYVGLLNQSIDNAAAKLTADISRLLLDNKSMIMTHPDVFSSQSANFRDDNILPTVKSLLGFKEEARRSENHSGIQKGRADRACSWITQDPEFNRWYSAPGSGFLVLFGAMGCGKTVTTAYVIDHLIQLNDNTVFGHLVCYHYCNTDETSDTIYVYSSILQQLFNQRPGLKITFDTWHDTTRRSEGMDPTKSSRLLGRFIAECVKSLDRTLIIVIDGVDECNDQSLPEILALLKGISEETDQLKIFLSSRSSEGIEGMLRDATQITLRHDQERDAIVADHLVSNTLGGLTESTRSLVVKSLRDSADGSVIWIKLTVDLIRKRRISAYAPMERFLKDVPLPSELSGLYSQLFKEVTEGDDENMRLAGAALEILAVARRPLSILELGWASALTEFSELITPDTTVDELTSWVDEKRILSLIQPFLGHVDFGNPRMAQLKLAHHSLKVLILRCAPSAWEGARNLDQATGFKKTATEPRQAKLEARLLGACVKYLLFQGFDDDKTKLLSEDDETIRGLAGLPQGDGLFEDNDTSKPEEDEDAPGPDEPVYFSPSARGFGEFFAYASCYWLDHFQSVPWELSPGTHDIVSLCRAKSTRLRNWVDQYCRPDCTVIPEFNWEAGLLDPLVVAATFGPPAAVKAILRDYDLAGPQFLSETVAAAARNIISHGKISELHSFLCQERIGLTPQTLPIYMHAMAEWTKPGLGAYDDEARDKFFDLVRDATPLLLTDGWGNELLCRAAAAGCLPVIERLFDEARGNPALRAELLRDRQREENPERHEKHQSVGEAARGNHVEVVRYLIRQPGIEPHLHHRDSGGNNVIAMAARYGNPEIVRMLVERYPEGVDEEDNGGNTPMIEFLYSRTRAEAVRILLEVGGADPNHKKDWYSALRVAIRHGDVEVCRALVEGGADPRGALQFNEGRAVGLADDLNDEEVKQKMFDMLCQLGGIRKVDSLQV